MRRPLSFVALLAAAWAAASCDLVLEINLGSLDHGTGGAGGTGGAPFCTPGEEQECYTGPAGTKGQGICKSGKQTCNTSGSAFGACEGELLPAVEDCTTTDMDEDCDGSSTCEEELWYRRFGDPQDQFGRAVAVNPAGEIAIAGSFLGAIDFGDFFLTDSGNDAFVAKLDIDGHPLWAQQIGGEGSQTILAIAVDGTGSVIVTGSFSGTLTVAGQPFVADQVDSFVVKLSPQGDLVWVRTVAGTKTQTVRSVAVDAAGNIVVAGFFDGTADFDGSMVPSAGNLDAFVAKLDPNGALVWARTYGDAAEQRATAVGVDASASVFLAGHFLGKIDLGDGPSPPASSNSAFVVKIGPDGNALWGRTFATALASGKVSSLAVQSAGSVVIGGEISGTLDFGCGPVTSSENAIDTFVADLDSNGMCVWSSRFGSTSVRALAATGDSQTLVCGTFDGALSIGPTTLTGAGGDDGFLAVFDDKGGIGATHAYGDADNQEILGCAGTPTGKAILIGDFAGTLDLGSGPLKSAGGRDVFVAKVAP